MSVRYQHGYLRCTGVRTVARVGNSCGGNKSRQVNACTAPPWLELQNSIN
jgi:hypothetical protein